MYNYIIMRADIKVKMNSFKMEETIVKYINFA